MTDNCKNGTEDKKSALSKTTEMKVGKVNYIVTTHYNENGRETAEEKIFRYVSDCICAKNKSPENAVT